MLEPLRKGRRMGAKGKEEGSADPHTVPPPLLLRYHKSLSIQTLTGFESIDDTKAISLRAIYARVLAVSVIRLQGRRFKKDWN